MPSVSAEASAAYNAPLLLGVFFIMNMLTYFDRGAISGSLNTLTSESTKTAGEFVLSDLQSGAIGAIYVLGFVVSSPIFSDYASRNKPFRVMVIGLFIWILAVLLTAVSPNFWVLFVARAASGAGEASFLCTAPVIIDIIAPPKSRSSWLSIYFSGIPIGFSLGVGLTGVWIEHGLWAEAYNWRLVFLAEGVVMLPFILFCLYTKGPDSLESLKAERERKREPDQELVLEEKVPFSIRAKRIITNELYILIVLGYSFQTFVVGGFSYYGDDFCEEYFRLSDTTASIGFGSVSFAAGLLGTGLGGWLQDYLRNRRGAITDLDNVKAATILLRYTSLILIPLSMVALSYRSAALFFPFVFLLNMGFCLCLSPVNSAIIWCTPLNSRPLAMSISVMSIHLLGDALSPFIIGGLLTLSDDNWILVMRILIIWLVLSSIFWWCSDSVAKKRVLKAEQEYLLGYSAQAVL